MTVKPTILVGLGLAGAMLACSQFGADQPTTAEPADVLDSTGVSQGSGFEPADIENDEGGPVTLQGEVAYTYPFFTAGVAEPVVILEDQAGFVDRDRNYLFPVASQVMGQITSDFYESPFTYSLSLPIEPQGTLRDVDHDGESDDGVMIYAVAYWTNTFGDPFLERRDQAGGGWSSAYASTRVSDDRDNYLEVYGGSYVVFAPDDQQGFPSGFGPDERLFSDDDPIVGLPQGWTVVHLDTAPFSFDRSRVSELELFEPESLALDDFSDMGYVEAFDAMLEKFRTEYAFTEFKGIDWDSLEERYRPQFEAAEGQGDEMGYALALRDFLWSIPDAHVGLDASALNDLFYEEVGGGLGLAIQELDDHRVIATFVLDGGPAADAGIVFGAEILEFDGQPIGRVLDANVPWSSPFSNEASERLQQLRYAVRFPVGTSVEVAFRNPGAEAQTASLQAVPEVESWTFSSLYRGVTGLELPVEFQLLDSGFGFVAIYSFFDNELLTIQLWERMIEALNENDVPGLIIDLRTNGGGSGFLADQMAAYFFDEELVLGNTGRYDDSIGEFYFDPGDENMFFLPREESRYHGDIVLLVGPACASACEFFAYDMTLQDRATVVGQYPTAGAGGSVEDFLMPEGISVRFTIGRAVDADGNIHIEGPGIVPQVRVPVSEQTIYAEFVEGRDVVLENAIDLLR
jgi:C-terminal processing protease CtpA/Prc